MSLLKCEKCGTRCSVDAPRCPHCASKNLTPDTGGGPVPPSVTVKCSGNPECPRSGQQRTVWLRQAAIGVVELPTLLCQGCGGVLTFAGGWPLPIEEEDMAKNTVHGGPSNAAAEAEPEQVEGSEPSSAGSSSQTSTEPQQPSPKTNEPEAPSPAPKTGSRSRKARTANSSAAGTAGDPEADTSASSDN